MDTQEEIRGRMSETLNTLGVTTHKAAALSGVANGNLNRQLSGKQTITPRTVAKIARALGVSYDWLLNGVGDMMDKCCPPPIDGEKQSTAQSNEEAIEALRKDIEFLKQQIEEKDKQIALLLEMLGKK